VDADDLKGAPESTQVHAFALNGQPHNPRREPLHAPPGGQLAPGKSTQPKVCVPERRTTRKVRLIGDKKWHNPKGATKRAAQQEGGKTSHAAPHITATSASRTTQRVRRSQRLLDRGKHEEEPHDPEGASIHPFGNAALASDGAAHLEGGVAHAALGASLARERTCTARRVRQNEPRINKGANNHTPLRIAQPLARAAQPEGCVPLCAPLRGGAPRPGGCVARATIGVTRPRGCRTTQRVRRSTQLTVLRVRQREPHYPEGRSLRMPFGVALVRRGAAQP